MNGSTWIKYRDRKPTLAEAGAWGMVLLGWADGAQAVALWDTNFDGYAPMYWRAPDPVPVELREESALEKARRGFRDSFMGLTPLTPEEWLSRYEALIDAKLADRRDSDAA